MSGTFPTIFKLFLLLILLMPVLVFGQSQLYTINAGLLNDSLMTQSGCLSLHKELNDQLYSVGVEAIKVYQGNEQYALILIQGGCMSAAQEKQLRDSIVADHHRMLAFEEYLTDTLALLKDRLNGISTKIVHSILKEMYNGQPAVCVIDQSLVKYADDSSNLNEQLLQLFKLRLNDPAFRQRLDLATAKAMENLKIEEHLKFHLKPMPRIK